MAEQKIVARIKRSSKYFHQSPPQKWFTARVVNDPGYPIRGNLNNYRLADVALGVLVDGAVVELASGKVIRTADVYDIRF